MGQTQSNHISILNKIVADYKKEAENQHYGFSESLERAKHQRDESHKTHRSLFMLKSENMIAVFFKAAPAFRVSVFVKDEKDKGNIIIDDVVIRKRMADSIIFLSLGSPVSEATARYIWQHMCSLGMTKHTEDGDDRISYKKVMQHLREWRGK